MGRDLLAAADEGVASALGKDPKFADALAQRFATINNAFAQSGGRADKAIAGLTGIEQELVRNRLISGGVSGDEMAKHLQTSGDKGWLQRLWNAPAEANELMETRMRGGMYIALRDGGMGEAEAVATVKRMALDYDMSSTKNRIFRDLFPFGAFVSQTVPQTLKSPATLALASNAYAQATNEPIYPSMEGNVNLRAGYDEKGNPTYLTSLGLPFEVLGDIPLSGDEGRKAIGQMHPFIKTAYGAITGNDASFGTRFGSYDKSPALLQALGVDEHGEVGRHWSMLRGSGLVQPLMPLFDPINTLLDDTQTAGQKASRLLTGARVQSVDTDRAVQQQLEEALRENPRIKTHTSFYDQSGDEEMQALLQHYRDATKVVRDKRKAELLNP
jgi:hypothetical protein